jgi:hypothetical protein
LTGSKKVWDQPAVIRHGWIDPGEPIAVVQQCTLAGVCRAPVYAQCRPPVVDASDLIHSRLIDEEYTRQPLYGTRRMVIFLRNAGHTVNRQRVQQTVMPGVFKELQLGEWESIAHSPNLDLDQGAEIAKAYFRIRRVCVESVGLGLSQQGTKGLVEECGRNPLATLPTRRPLAPRCLCRE